MDKTVVFFSDSQCTLAQHHQNNFFSIISPKVSGSPPLSDMVTERRMRRFGHIARNAPREDHHRAVASIRLETTSRKTQPHAAQSD